MEINKIRTFSQPLDLRKNVYRKDNRIEKIIDLWYSNGDVKKRRRIWITMKLM